MIDIILEAMCSLLVGGIIYVLMSSRTSTYAKKHKGWTAIIIGLSMIFFGMVIDITDNFPQLNGYILIGNTPYQTFLEEFVGILLGLSVFCFGVRTWLPSVLEVEKKNTELETSRKDLENKLREMKTLRGIVPICMYCKNMRCDDGQWKQVEEFITQRTDAELSHGICSSCMEENHPDEFEQLQK